MAASVVDLPEPVAPVTITRPRLDITISCSVAGRSSSATVGMRVLMVRSTMPALPCWMKAEARKRPALGTDRAKLHSWLTSNSAICRSFMMARTSPSAWVALSGCCETGVILPSTLIAGGKSAVMNRSEPRLPTISTSSSWMYLAADSRSSMAQSCGCAWYVLRKAGGRCLGGTSSRRPQPPVKASGFLAMARASP